jgi:hypothetical protein
MAVAARCLAGLVGLGIIGCVAHAGVMASGGYGSTAALLVWALAAGLAVGSLAVGVACHEGRRVIAYCLIAALVAGEAWSLLLTAERTIAHRDEQQAPLREAAEARAKAGERVRLAEAALAAIGTTPRLVGAQKAKTAADAAVVEKASERGCVSNCRQLLQKAVDDAAAEVAAARVEIENARIKAESVVKQARIDFNALPMPRSATPLADRLGVEGWQVDLVAAALASLAANGLAAFLLAFAAHGRAQRPLMIDVTPSAAANTAIAGRERDPADEADSFARTTFRPKSTGRVRLAEIKQAYHGWCHKRGLDPLPDRDIGQALNALFASVALYRRGEGAEAAIVGIDWRSSPHNLQIEAPEPARVH